MVLKVKTETTSLHVVRLAGRDVGLMFSTCFIFCATTFCCLLLVQSVMTSPLLRSLFRGLSTQVTVRNEEGKFVDDKGFVVIVFPSLSHKSSEVRFWTLGPDDSEVLISSFLKPLFLWRLFTYVSNFLYSVSLFQITCPVILRSFSPTPYFPVFVINVSVTGLYKGFTISVIRRLNSSRCSNFVLFKSSVFYS